jgi:glycosyltransferase involved in cell wall biosynthesis
MKHPPLVSVILPTFNRAGYLPRSVESVISQSLSDWELIVEDDGSTDESPELLEEWRRSEPRIRFCPHPNIGPAECRNHGESVARGRYIAFIDSDDEYLPEHIALRAEYLERNPDTAFLHGGVLFRGAAARMSVPDARDPSRLIRLEDCVIGGSFFARRGTIPAAGGWVGEYGEDYNLYLRVKEKFRVDWVDFRTYVYHRDTPDSRCTGRSDGVVE